MKKYTFAVMFIITVGFTLAGCGLSSPSSSTQPMNKNAGQQVQQATMPAETSTEELEKELNSDSLKLESETFQ